MHDRASPTDHRLLAAQVCCVSRTREGNRHAARSRAPWLSGFCCFVDVSVDVKCRLSSSGERLHGDVRLSLVLTHVQVVDFVYTDVIYAWGKRHDVGQMRCDSASQRAATQQSAFVIPGVCHLLQVWPSLFTSRGIPAAFARPTCLHDKRNGMVNTSLCPCRAVMADMQQRGVKMHVNIWTSLVSCHAERHEPGRWDPTVVAPGHELSAALSVRP